jgi:hypothetical protein
LPVPGFWGFTGNLNKEWAAPFFSHSSNALLTLSYTLESYLITIQEAFYGECRPVMTTIKISSQMKNIPWTGWGRENASGGGLKGNGAGF